MLAKVRRALVSVSDKTSLPGWAQVLAERNVELVSTGGTFSSLAELGFSVRQVSALTEFPEIMDGRVKTLLPRVHGGLLAVRDNNSHDADMADHGILSIELLVANLYLFEQIAVADGFRETVFLGQNLDAYGRELLSPKSTVPTHCDLSTTSLDCTASASQQAIRGAFRIS